MRLLIYNPNTTQAVTDRLVAQARRHASPDTQIVGLFFLDAPVADIVTVQADHGAALEAACRDIAARGDVSSIVLGGGPLAGLADSFRARIPVPLLDGVACAVRHAETVVACVNAADAAHLRSR